ncbi:hypothetical protein SLS58_006035 [Diplodia intermedia]|uniref:Uncharacterized protein n=1 Tax=Diplodia intermedia TaxID=856260 RepID=A0ABR3TPS7_9PEZI
MGHVNKKTLLKLPELVKGTNLKRSDEYLRPNWSALKDKLKREYRNNDSQTRFFRREFLNEFLMQNQEARRTVEGLQDYITNYHMISEALLNAKSLSEQQQGLECLKGLPRDMSERLIRECGIKLSRPSTYQYDMLRGKLLDIVEEMETSEKISNVVREQPIGAQRQHSNRR